MKSSGRLKAYLDRYAARYNRPDFIPDDPVRIPHRFTRKQDIEIMGFFAATLAWGRRATIIRKCSELIDYMDKAPYDFIQHHAPSDLKPLLRFRHRTFQPTDLLYFVHFLRDFYARHDSLEDAFAQYLQPDDAHTGPALEGFHRLFFSLPDAPARTRKHVATPVKRSTCKRLNMFLRWMVRRDKQGVDFGIWTKIRPDQLLCPVDVHVNRVARRLGLIKRRQTDWQSVLELNRALKTLHADDPVRYDFALFGLGIRESGRVGV